MALPTPPPEMERADEAGAVATVTYFLTELYPYTVSSQDTDSWLALSHDLCVYCNSVAKSVRDEADSGLRTIPGVVEILSQSTEEANPLEFGVRLDISTGTDLRWSSTGAFIGKIPPHRVSLGVVVVWHIDRWIVRAVDVFSSEVIA